MTVRSKYLLAVLAATAALGILSASGVMQAPQPDGMKLPPGFSITTYATGVRNARQMALSPGGTLYAGSMSAGNVYAIVDRDKDYRADEVITIASGLNQPSGIAFRDGALYVGEIHRIIRFDDIDGHLNPPPRPVVVDATLPTETHHGAKFLAFGPDGLLYVPVGAPCNVCTPDERHGLIFRMKPDGSGREEFAAGIRNSVGFDWDPQTRELWFTDNGRDSLGDNIPPDELNHAPAKGMNFGFPGCHGHGIKDPEFGRNANCSAITPPGMDLGPHVAPLGMTFYTGSMFPPEYRNQIIIAEHGSWNRSQKIGYRLSIVRLQANKAVKYEPFAEGWLQGQNVLGRPADVLVMPDGSLLVSDDYTGVIYRITYRSQK